MCEQTPVEYKDGDIVWVKLDRTWWPGEVVSFESLPLDITGTLKSKPLVTVKFFQEDKYQFIKKLPDIYYYNCSLKDEFIARGLKVYRNKIKYMEKFPADICTAETRTNGNPNILNDPIFAPPQKVNINEIFGSPSTKKPVSPKKKRTSLTSHGEKKGSSKTQNIITHPRFLGKDDHVVSELIQKPRNPPPVNEKTYKCSKCGFSTTRIEVVIYHGKSHSRGSDVATPSNKKARKPKVLRKELKMPRTKTTTIDEDLELLQKGFSIHISSSNDEDESLPESPKVIRKKKVVKRKNTKPKPRLKPEVEKDVRTDILAEWQDDSDEDGLKTTNDTDKQKVQETVLGKKVSTENEKLDERMTTRLEISTETSLSEKDSNKNDIDKDGNDADTIIKVSQDNSHMDTDEITAKDLKSLAAADSDESFKSLLESTSIASVPDISDLPKLHIDPKIDKKITRSSEKTDTHPKKRFVKSFEDFELLLKMKNEKKPKESKPEEKGIVKTAEDVPEKPMKEGKSSDADTNIKPLQKKDTSSESKTKEKIETKEIKSLEVSKLKSQLMNKLSTATENDQSSNKETKKGDNKKDVYKDKKLTLNKNKEEHVPEKENLDESVAAVGSKLEDKISVHKEKVKEGKVSKNEEISEPEEVLESAEKINESEEKLLEPEKKLLESEEKLLEEKLLESEEKLIEEKLLESEEKQLESEKYSELQEEILESQKNDLELEDMGEEHINVQIKEDVVEDVFETDYEAVALEQKSDNIMLSKQGMTDRDVASFSLNVNSEKVEQHEVISTSKKIDDEKSKLDPDKAHPDNLDLDSEHLTEAKKPEVVNVNKMEIDAIDVENKKDLKKSILVNSDNNNCTDAVESKKTETLSNVLAAVPENIPAQHVITESVLPELNSNISNEDMCPLSTLAAVSELSTTLEPNIKTDLNFPEVKSPCNLTVMSENELANAEVEIAAGSTNLNTEMQATATLASFSVDFSDLGENKMDKLDTTSGPEDKKVNTSVLTETHTDDVKVEEENVIEQRLEEKKGGTLVNIELENNSVESEIAKLTDTDPNTEIITEKPENTSSSKLLKILTDSKAHNLEFDKTSSPGPVVHNNIILKSGKKPSTVISSKEQIFTKLRHDMKGKIVLKSSSSVTNSASNKPVILSEKILAPGTDSSKMTMKKVTSKRHMADADDLDKYIIQRPVKRAATDEELTVASNFTTYKKTPSGSATKGKPKILQQTIITAAGNIIQPNVSQIQQDDNVFDIDSMPIVLSDQILTPETIESMPIVISEPMPTSSSAKPLEKINIVQRKVPAQQVKLLNKSASPVIMKETPGRVTSSTIKLSSKLAKQKIYPAGSKLRSTSIITSPGKPGKFVIVPPTTTATGSKYTVGKRTQLVKKTASPGTVLTTTSKLQNESTGNKIMIVTDNQGQQSKVLLTPAQQKLLGYSGQTKILKSAVKGNVIHKQVSKDGSSVIAKQTIIGQKPVIVSSSGTITSMSALKGESPRFVKKIAGQRVLMSPTAKPTPATHCKTVVIKNNKGQTIKRIATTDAMLDQQVAEQIEAIHKATAKKIITKPSSAGKLIEKKTIVRKPLPAQTTTKQILAGSSAGNVNLQASSKSMNVPPLAPISPMKKSEALTHGATVGDKSSEDKTAEPQRPPHQLIIQDAGGFKTTITEGQILALPSETVDGQPQSYMLVTLDETGNLTPLSNEALMSLDPNLNLGGDLSNMILHIDQKDQASKPVEQRLERATEQTVKTDNVQEVTSANVVEDNVPALSVPPSTSAVETVAAETSATQPNVPVTSGDTTTVQGITCNINSGDVNRQLLITGDPAATQKFLESLSEGNSDLANLLASAEGNILIQADGQQILINTDPENQMLLMNSEAESSEGNSNPIFANQPSKNQDILAAALADTDVFQQEPNQVKATQSQLSPTNGMYPLTPLNVVNVLETSSMNSPIMTPLEIPSTNSKKIDDEASILSQVPKNVDLPITITDPNISQTVAQQQVSSLIVNDLQSNLELPLSISDPTISATATEMNSPNFVYSLPTLDDSDISQKAFNSSISMPLLTEESDDTLSEPTVTLKGDDKLDKQEEALENQDDKSNYITTVDEGLCTLRSGMCNSLSEPPPDMFDFPIASQAFNAEPENKVSTDRDITLPAALVESRNVVDEDSVGQEIFGDEEKLNTSATYQNFDEQKLDTPSTNTDENSCEIPVQPEIVTDLISTTEEQQSQANDKAATVDADVASPSSKRKTVEDDDEDVQSDERDVKKSKVD